MDVQTVQAIIHSVANDGALIVFFAFAMATAWQWSNSLLRRSEHKKRVDRHDDLLEVRKETSGLINDKLTELMYKSGSSRAYVVEYHNGGEGLGGMPFLKMSNTGEVCNTGVDSFQTMFQNIPCYKYPTLVNKIDKESYIVLDSDAKDLTLSEDVYKVLEMQGMGKSIFTRITGNKGRTIGYIGLDYNIGNDNFNKVNVEDLKTLAIQVGAWLSVR